MQHVKILIFQAPMIPVLEDKYNVSEGLEQLADESGFQKQQQQHRQTTTTTTSTVFQGGADGGQRVERTTTTTTTSSSGTQSRPRR